VPVGQPRRKESKESSRHGVFSELSGQTLALSPVAAVSKIETRQLTATNFEVIQGTGPRVDAGPDLAAPVETAVALNAQVFYTNTPPLICLWKLYAGPGSVTFSATNQASATATSHAPGDCTVMFSAENGVHAVAYDAVTITVGGGQRPDAPTNLRVVESQ